MLGLIKNLKDFINKKYCMLTLAVSILASTLIALTEGIIKILKIDTQNVILFKGHLSLDNVLRDARIIFIYFAANALVGLLIELRSRLKIVEKETHESFTNLTKASEKIKDVIKNAAYKRQKEKLIIQVYGRRHRQNMSIIKQALEEIKKNTKIHRKILIYLYYSNPDFLESLKSFNDKASLLE